MTDTNGKLDVFLHDSDTGQTRLVSHMEGLPTQAGNGGSSGVGMSAEGNVVLLTSTASGIDTDGGIDWSIPSQLVYETVFDQAETLPHSAMYPRYNPAGYLASSADGSRIVYRADVPDGAQEAPAGRGIYLLLHDRDRLGFDVVNSSAFASVPAPNGQSEAAGISADGNTVMFGSTATNLVRGMLDGNGTYDVFLATRSDRIFRSEFEFD